MSGAAVAGSVEPIGGGRMTAWQRIRFTGNWINLSTSFGLLAAHLGRASIRRGARGLYLADGYRYRFPVAAAFTVGNVVITRHTWGDLLAARPGLLLHEERHSTHYLICGGLGFLPLYGLAMLWSYARTRTPALGNAFERDAGLAAGGYL